MSDLYPLLHQGREVGTVEVVQEGLYLNFTFKCKYLQDQIYFAWIEHDGQQKRMGVFTPSDDGLILLKRIPSKYIQCNKCSYFVGTESDVIMNEFIMLNDNGEFSCFEEIKGARFAIQNGHAGILIATKYSCPRKEDPRCS